MIRLDVRLENVRDPHVLLRGRLEVRLDVVLWIHHSAAGCAASAEQVAGAAGLGREELTQNHEAPPAACHTNDLRIGSNSSWQSKRSGNSYDRTCRRRAGGGPNGWHRAWSDPRVAGADHGDH